MDNITCSICLSDILDNNCCITNCNHTFCYTCLNIWFEKKKISCPICRADIDSYNYNNKITRIIYIDNIQRQIVPRQNNINTIIINKKFYIILQVLSIFSVILSGVNISLLVTCND